MLSDTDPKNVWLVPLQQDPSSNTTPTSPADLYACDWRIRIHGCRDTDLIGWKRKKMWDRNEESDDDDVGGGKDEDGNRGGGMFGWMKRYKPRPLENFLTGFIALATYLIGVVFMTSRLYTPLSLRPKSSHQTTHRRNNYWTPSPFQLNLLNLILCLGPPTTTTITIITLGTFTYNTTISQYPRSASELTISAHYIIWSIWCLILTVAFSIFGSKLIKVLKHHQKTLKSQIDQRKQQHNGYVNMGTRGVGMSIDYKLKSELKRLELGILRIWGLMIVNLSILVIFAVVLSYFGGFRVEVLKGNRAFISIGEVPSTVTTFDHDQDQIGTTSTDTLYHQTQVSVPTTSPWTPTASSPHSTYPPPVSSKSKTNSYYQPSYTSYPPRRESDVSHTSSFTHGNSPPPAAWFGRVEDREESDRIIWKTSGPWGVGSS
ncbi:hypothetical protein HDU76_004120 [Blyttiomyces sp. JEL0837]|nr:hypothetical protein HDU76_004120 [Blyttiomyces sp. JEL0837]